MIRFLVAIILCLGVSGCKTIEERKASAKIVSYRTLKSIQYIKDERTQVCFAILSKPSGVKAMSAVPCDKVEQLVDLPYDLTIVERQASK